MALKSFLVIHALTVEPQSLRETPRMKVLEFKLFSQCACGIGITVDSCFPVCVVGSGVQTKTIRPGSSRLYSLSHPADYQEGPQEAGCGRLGLQSQPSGG